MIILTLRTDKPEAEIGLFLDEEETAYEIWQAHRQLAETLHRKIAAQLKTQSLGWADIGGIVVYEGPGSFTGLRIGISVANALANSYGLPVVGVAGEDWINSGLSKLKQGVGESIVLPQYGAPVHITQPKK